MLVPSAWRRVRRRLSFRVIPFMHTLFAFVL
jgi:hypothetical protein